MNLWDVKFDWVFHSGVTMWPSQEIVDICVWEKVNRLNDYITGKTIDSLDEMYFKFQKCISGLTYQYVLDLYNIYERNIMVGDPYYTELFYNEYDVINEYMNNFNYVDFYISENVDITEKITKIDNNYLKSSHKILLTEQTDKIENGIYSFDSDGVLQKSTDLDTTGQTYRYGVHVKMDTNNNIEFFLVNSGNTFPTTDDEKVFTTGHTYVLKCGFYYNINNTGTTYDSIPKLWFTDYNFTRKLNDENSDLYNNIEISTIPTSNLSIQYRNNPPVYFDVSLGNPMGYSGMYTYGYQNGKTVLTLLGIVPSTFCKSGDYLYIDTMSNVSSSENISIFFTTVDSFDGTNIILDEYIPNYVLSGITTPQLIEIDNLNNIKTVSSINLMYLNKHYYGDFFTFSGETVDGWAGTTTLKIIPKENEFSKYIDYDAFTFTFDSVEYRFTTDNHYIDYKLYEHLNDIDSGVFDMSFDLGSGFTMTSFTQEDAYLIDEPSYPQSIVDRDSPLKITPTLSSDLDYFYKYTNVYINNDFGDKVFVLDKDDISMTIERPRSLVSSGTLTSISSFYSLTGISETLYDVYINTGNTFYTKDEQFRNRIYKTYNFLLSNDSRIRQLTTGTITPNDNNDYILKLFNYRNSLNTILTGNTIGDVFYENDYNLLFSPLEIVDIGIDKQSKFPIRIFNDDYIISDTIESGHTVGIVKDSVENSITLVNGMTIEKLKVKYIWIFNAVIEDAIIGEDEYGLVWYKGTWVCGDWVDGTWYSGVWLNGIWKNGKWLSWLIDEYQLLSNDSLKKLDEDKKYSIFVNGTWRNGVWYNGIFGDDISISGYTSKVFLNHVDVLPNLDVATWENGTFYSGEFKNSIWENGYLDNGEMYGGYWKDGTFNNGSFDGNWWIGNFRDADFVSGIWEDGTFNRSRFGYNELSCSSTTTEWWDGTMNLSEMYAGVYTPINYNRTHWYNGVFRDSKWYSGHFFTGVFIDSIFYNGVFGTYNVDVLLNNDSIVFQSGDFLNGLWLDGVFMNGNFRNGIWYNGTFIDGNLRTIDE